jgi:hypothetical protein
MSPSPSESWWMNVCRCRRCHRLANNRPLAPRQPNKVSPGQRLNQFTLVLGPGPGVCPGQDSFLSFPMLSFDPTLIFQIQSLSSCTPAAGLLRFPRRSFVDAVSAPVAHSPRFKIDPQDTEKHKQSKFLPLLLLLSLFNEMFFLLSFPYHKTSHISCELLSFALKNPQASSHFPR